MKLTIKEKIACNVLRHLKYTEEEFIDCRFNDTLLNITKYILRVDPYELFEKITSN